MFYTQKYLGFPTLICKKRAASAESVFFSLCPHTKNTTNTHYYYFSKMTINDHDQFTGLNAVHVAASEGNVKKLVELMDDGAELDVPALGGARFITSRLLFFL